MNAAAGSADELETLARLREDERALDRRLETARQDAETRLAAAHREAARLGAQAEADLREELTSLPEEVAAVPQDSRPRGWQVSLRLPHPD
jgi:vacuolar-type H+-ATPase subunit H